MENKTGISQVPSIIFPECRGRFYVNQFEIGNQAFLRFEGRGAFNHPGITKMFGEELGLWLEDLYDQRWTDPKSKAEMPFLITGAGFCYIISLDEKIGDFEGDSETYNVGIDYGHLARLSREFPDWIFRKKEWYELKDRRGR